MALSARRLAVVAGGVALAVTACAPTASVELSTVAPSPESRATIAAEPAGPKRVAPTERIVVRASDGQLADVTVTGPKGPLAGDLSEDGTVWTARKPTLAFGTTYTVAATAIDPRGVPTTTTSEIRTVEPSDFVHATIDPGQGALVGVGMPITVDFDRDVINKEAIERALVVYTPTPIEGAWSWNGPRQVQFRPRLYWPGNIDVTVAAQLKGVRAAKGVFGDGTTSVTFTTGPRRVIKVDAQAHQAKVFIDGEKARTIPVTTGKDGFETRSGTLIILTREPTRIMDAATGGTDPSDPEYYRLEVQYAMRITYSGEFLHAAPWSVGSQGYANVSHGCIGMSTANAQWLFDQVNLGDVVEVTGTSVPQNLGNGVTVWTETWEEWLAGSRAGAVMTTPTPATTPDATVPDTTTPDATTPDSSSTTAGVATQTAYRR